MSRQGFIKIVIDDSGQMKYAVNGNLQIQDVILVCTVLQQQFVQKSLGGGIAGSDEISKRLREGLGK